MSGPSIWTDGVALIVANNEGEAMSYVKKMHDPPTWEHFSGYERLADDRVIEAWAMPGSFSHRDLQRAESICSKGGSGSVLSWQDGQKRVFRSHAKTLASLLERGILMDGSLGDQQGFSVLG